MSLGFTDSLFFFLILLGSFSCELEGVCLYVVVADLPIGIRVLELLIASVRKIMKVGLFFFALCFLC